MTTSTTYRFFALTVLLATCVHNMASRNLPSYLITVQVPGCEESCNGVAVTPLCETKSWALPERYGEAQSESTGFQVCQLCRAQSWPFSDSANNSALLDANYYNFADGGCLSTWEYGILIGYGFAVFFAIGSIPSGYVIDRKPRIVVLSLSMLAWSLATASQASAHSFGCLIYCRVIMGIAQAFAMPASMSLAADLFPENTNFALAVLSFGMYLGSGCSSFTILIAKLVGWRWAVLVTGISGIILAAFQYLTIHEPERSEWSTHWSLTVVGREVFTKSRVSRCLVVAASCKMLAAFCLSSFLPIWYSRSALKGYSNDVYAPLNAIVIAGGGVLSIGIGIVLGDWWSRRNALAPCWIGFIGSILSLPLICFVLFATDFYNSMFYFFLLLVVGECWFGPTVALLQASVLRSARGQAVSLFLCAATLAANLGPALIGFLDPGDADVGHHLLWVCFVANVGAAIAFLATAHEVSIDPVAAAGDKSCEPMTSPRGSSSSSRAGIVNWGTL